ncbi:MAG: metal-dependent hydrolase [Bryobacteraceae bacterium]|nr:metal-dependent hydrolase [Bryobacteraceae bacterium]
MDNITHSLTGFLLSRVGFNRWPLPAAWLLAIGANIPDADFASALGGDELILECHRGPTHSFLFSPLVALAPPAIVALAARRRLPWLRAWLVSWAGVLSHLLLDWTNIYGARLLSPLNEEWYALSINSVMDLWIWIILFSAVGWMVISRLVTSEIGAGRSSGRGVAVVALLGLVAFDFGRFVLHERARNVLDARVYSDELPQRAQALPTVANPFRWRGIVETRSAYHLFEVNLLETRFDPASGRVFYKPELPPVAAEALATEPFRKFLWFAKFPLWRIAPAEAPDAAGGTMVQVIDLRFALPGEDAFAATALFDARGGLVRSWFQYEAPGAPPRFR